LIWIFDSIYYKSEFGSTDSGSETSGSSGAIEPLVAGKTRITIRLDDEGHGFGIKSMPQVVAIIRA
jgi:hypothetical protein